MRIWMLLLLVNAPVLTLEAGDGMVDFSALPEPQVGVPTQLSFVVRDAATGKPGEDVWIKVEIIMVEDDLEVFSGDFYSRDGRLTLTYHFQDAGEYAINLEAYSVSETFLVEVKPPPPPTRAWLKTWTFLMGLLVLGIGVGFYAVKFYYR